MFCIMHIDVIDIEKINCHSLPSKHSKHSKVKVWHARMM